MSAIGAHGSGDGGEGAHGGGDGGPGGGAVAPQGEDPAGGLRVALAWLLHRSPVVLPIPGTSRLAHLEENVAAAAVTLSEADLADL